MAASYCCLLRASYFPRKAAWSNEDQSSGWRSQLYPGNLSKNIQLPAPLQPPFLRCGWFGGRT